MAKSWKKQVGSISALAFGAAMLVACGDQSSGSASSDQNQLVECYGVAKKANTPILMTKGMCDKLPATKQVAVKSDSTAPIKFGSNVKCFGVAAAGKNDCATKTTSCAGSAKKARQPDAWVSLPEDICKNLKGSSVGKAS